MNCVLLALALAAPGPAASHPSSPSSAAQAASPAPAPAPQAPPSGEATGSTACSTPCHEPALRLFERSAHGRWYRRQGLQPWEKACEDCHGPGKRHSDESAGLVEFVTPDALPPYKADYEAACLRCHGTGKGAMDPILHNHPLVGNNRFGLGCVDCHVSGHGEVEKSPEVPVRAQLSRPSPELCLSCHPTIKGAFNLPHRHRGPRGPADCSECHSIHAKRGRTMTREDEVRQVCVTCHVEYKGPFVFEHVPARHDGCLACHVPHGSSNPRMLRKPVPIQLCSECHSGIPAFHNPGANPVFTNCVLCHVSIHGSNRERKFFR